MSIGGVLHGKGLERLGFIMEEKKYDNGFEIESFQDVNLIHWRIYVYKVNTVSYIFTISQLKRDKMFKKTSDF